MSYRQTMKWQSKHRKGTQQPLHFTTGSGFWPARAWLEEEWWPYLERCKAEGTEPIGQREFYDRSIRR